MYETCPMPSSCRPLFSAIEPGAREAIIDFGRAPLELGNHFASSSGSNLWPIREEDSWAILGACFQTAAGTKDELVLCLGAQHLSPYFQHHREPLPKVPPQGQWTHLALAYNRGQWLQAMYPHEEQKYYEGKAISCGKLSINLAEIARHEVGGELVRGAAALEHGAEPKRSG